MSAAIEAARQKAAAAQQNVENLPAVSAEVHNLPTTSRAPAPALSMDQMKGGMMVDLWIKVKEDGLKAGDNAGLQEEILVSIEMTDGRGFKPKLCVKAGNPAQYFSS